MKYAKRFIDIRGWTQEEQTWKDKVTSPDALFLFGVFFMFYMVNYLNDV